MNTASKNIFTLVFAIIFSLVSISTLSAQTVWLDKLDLSTATQGWGIPKKNRSVDGNIMTIAGKTFERGFGTHAESSLFIQL
ncbi:MAG: NPCBM/NEW2 domain-containing protein, partial [Ferruginibacter sp.]